MMSFQTFIYLFLIIITITIKTLQPLEIPESNGERVECNRSKIDHNVTLTAGQKAGSFLKSNKSIHNMDECVQQCCQMQGCDVAFFNNGDCYSVICKTIQSCAPTANLDKRMQISISYVAKKHPVNKKELIVDQSGEPAITDNLVSEVTKENPFTLDDDTNELENDSDQQIIRARRESWRETKDMIVAIGCGFVAVAVGVAGVIMMTRQLVEDDDIFIDYGEPASQNISNTKEERNELQKTFTERKEEACEKPEERNITRNKN